MGVLDGQPVDAAVTNPAFINKNVDDQMPNKLGFTRPLSGSNIADIQQAVNNIYTATGVSEVASGTDYVAPPNTINIGDSYLTALSKIAQKFDAVTGHDHDGTPGNGPILMARGVTSLAASGYPAATGDVIIAGVSGTMVSQFGNTIYVASTGGGGGSGPGFGGTFGFYTGYFANGTFWQNSATSYSDPTQAGSSPVLVTRLESNLAVTAATGNLPGITFTPDSADDVYFIVATTNIFNSHSPAGFSEAQLTDGVIVINAAGSDQSLVPGAQASVVPMTLSGIYMPGTTNPTTVKIQTRSQAGTGTTTIGETDQATAIEWTIYKLTAGSFPVYFAGYMPNGTSWGSSSPTYVDPTPTGVNTLTTREMSGITVSAASGNLPGITFTPQSANDVYFVQAISSLGTNVTDWGSLQLTDGTNVISTVGALPPGGTSSETIVPVTLSGIYAPGGTSPVTVKIQVASGSGGTTLGDENLAQSIEWVLYKLNGITSGGAGVTSLNSLTGALNIVAGSGLALSATGSSITLSATGGFTPVVPTAIDLTGSGTYTFPTSPAPLYCEFEACGAGGGGAGSSGSGGGATAGGAGGNGSDTVVSGSGFSFTCRGGEGGHNNAGAGAPSVGGFNSSSGVDVVVNVVGGYGCDSFNGPQGGLGGPSGGTNPFGGAGPGGTNNGADAGDASPTTGAGGGGAGSNSASPPTETGGAGAAGGYLKGIILNPTGMMTYSVPTTGGTAGAGGAGSPGGNAGGAGGSAKLVLKLYYQ